MTQSSGSRAPVAKSMTKNDLVAALAQSTGISAKDVRSVLDELTAVVERHVGNGGVGSFTLPGLLKIKAVTKPAKPARTMRSPFSGEMIKVAAKPASKGVKIQALSGLKRMVG